MINLSVSFIMPVFDESISELKESINSVLNQTYKNFNLIIIDDNPTSVMLKRFLSIVSSNNKIVKLLINDKSVGAAISRNRGIRYSRSDLIAIMDADDISSRMRLECQVNFIKKYNLDLIFSNCKDFNSKYIKPKNISFNTKIINQSVLKYLFSHYYDCAVHSSWLVRRNVYINLDGYRNLRHGEDFDFIIRTLSYKYKIGYQPKVLVYKRQRNNSVSNSNQLKQFNISVMLMKFARRFKYNKIIPLKDIYISQNKINVKSINNFIRFLRLGHNVKYNFSIVTLLKFMLYTITSINSMRYLIEIFKTPIYKYKIRKMISNEDAS